MSLRNLNPGCGDGARTRVKWKCWINNAHRYIIHYNIILLCIIKSVKQRTRRDVRYDSCSYIVYTTIYMTHNTRTYRIQGESPNTVNLCFSVNNAVIQSLIYAIFKHAQGLVLRWNIYKFLGFLVGTTEEVSCGHIIIAYNLSTEWQSLVFSTINYLEDNFSEHINVKIGNTSFWVI